MNRIYEKIIFNSSYGELTLNPIQKPDILLPEWLEAEMNRMNKQLEENNWENAYKIIDNIYLFDHTDIPEEFWKTLDLFMSKMMFYICESGNYEREYNPCYIFNDSKFIHEIINFRINEKILIGPKNENDDKYELKTVAVYLSGLFSFFNGSKDPSNTSLLYRNAITKLNIEEPKRNFVSWAIKNAFEDKITLEIAKEWRVLPSL